ncbi:MAG: hypothetical protein UT63_C0008G0016 [Candidatus Gottesmanbacteria bacterium GW2011_GWC2_39_8]|uniref:Uncharacterized protein n=1 Tax=Candidatus Gottesmanbacteria bacterium GW2011_GWC2_39_8 TaxID=1618450 RepID=A0A0G0T7Z2_9BACT|nr:MAG: hypothetical protein UT63_C0008G0016 [Candidatus Gottesmanbacteria bacterium GW2011_GWC2_39_8]
MDSVQDATVSHVTNPQPVSPTANSNPNVIVSPNAPPPQSKLNLSIFLIPLFIILLVTVGGLSAYLYTENNKKNETKYTNPFNQTYENPFANIPTPSAGNSYENPFETETSSPTAYQNPFQALDNTKSNQTYQNPFEKLKQ